MYGSEKVNEQMKKKKQFVFAQSGYIDVRNHHQSKST